jgi:hypothetical protein
MICLHAWEDIATIVLAEIDEHDPEAHTAFVLLGCMHCRTVDAFPQSNAALCTGRYVDELRRQLRAGGWRLPEGIEWVAYGRSP